jgi:sugar-specific transcriptional regulator TrmB
MKHSEIISRIEKIDESLKKIERHNRNFPNVPYSPEIQRRMDSLLKEIEDFMENVKPVLDLVEYCEGLISNK